jgi:uncharacterized protein (TIGR02145 family)
MNITRMVFAGLLAASACSAQSVNISGVVKNNTGVGIAGAIVTLEKGRQKDTTNADGSFALLGGAVAIQQRNSASLPPKWQVSLNNGLLNINGGDNSKLEVIAFNLHGEVVSSLIKASENGGKSMSLPLNGAGVYLYKIRSGKSEVLLKNYSISAQHAATDDIGLGSSRTMIAKKAAAINDVIAATKTGYLDYRMIMADSDTSGIEIKMIVCSGTVTDTDGNVYHTVKIGDQEWTAENLKTTKYNDGTAIPKVSDSLTWFALTRPGYCYYANTTDIDSINKYGALYNWYVVNTKKLAPTGWHVPADSEWDTLQNYLIANGYNWDGTTTDNKIAKSLAAMADWKASSAALGVIGNDLTLNNKSGFSAVPAGLRLNYAAFNNKGFMSCWWSATAMEGMPFAYYRYLSNGYDYLERVEYFENSGLSVRLVKD